MRKRRAGDPARPQSELSEAPLFLHAEDEQTLRPAPPHVAKAETDDAPHYMGHHERLRDRFKKVGAEGLADYKVLQ